MSVTLLLYFARNFFSFSVMLKLSCHITVPVKVIISKQKRDYCILRKIHKYTTNLFGTAVYASRETR